MNFYIQNKQNFANQLIVLNKKYNAVSTLRLLSVIAFIAFAYYSIKEDYNLILIMLMIACAFSFIYLMNTHGKIYRKRTRVEALLNINLNEIYYLNREKIPFDNGAEFIDFKHAYSSDLDIFGENSLFQNLNRTETYKGKQMLAKLLLSVLPQKEIFNNQQAVKELSEKPEWRQEIMALGSTKKDSKILYNKLIDWAKYKNTALSGFVNAISYITPLLIAVAVIGYFVTGSILLLNTGLYTFVFNIVFLFSQYGKITAEISNTTEIHDTISRYSSIIKEIENQNFTTDKLKTVQAQLLKNEKASKNIKKLAELFSRMDTINNLVATVVFNGAFLFHIHTFRALLKWKKLYGDDLETWLDAIGEIEALSSLGNLYYNNQDFTFPKLNSEYKIKFKNLAHPLLNPNTRVGNDVDFNPQFMILTGSNMSGKSTFLRSLGINMVLAGIGGPICAAEAEVYPLPVLVSMRLSDSLSDSESYFFAEIKRLKEIMKQLQHKQAFVLLDEILRGTNSDDKRTGTIEVVKKMVAYKAIGAIATHDIEVCETTFNYPEDLTNQCFEVQIVNNDLYFDYKLRGGICKNKSATFLMKKMGVI